MGFDRLYIWRWERRHSVTFHETWLFKFSECFIVDKVSNQDSNNGPFHFWMRYYAKVRRQSLLLIFSEKMNLKILRFPRPRKKGKFWWFFFFRVLIELVGYYKEVDIIAAHTTCTRDYQITSKRRGLESDLDGQFPSLIVRLYTKLLDRSLSRFIEWKSSLLAISRVYRECWLGSLYIVDTGDPTLNSILNIEIRGKVAAVDDRYINFSMCRTVSYVVSFKDVTHDPLALQILFFLLLSYYSNYKFYFVYFFYPINLGVVLHTLL